MMRFSLFGRRLLVGAAVLFATGLSGHAFACDDGGCDGYDGAFAAGGYGMYDLSIAVSAYADYASSSCDSCASYGTDNYGGSCGGFGGCGGSYDMAGLYGDSYGLGSLGTASYGGLGTPDVLSGLGYGTSPFTSLYGPDYGSGFGSGIPMGPSPSFPGFGAPPMLSPIPSPGLYGGAPRLPTYPGGITDIGCVVGMCPPGASIPFYMPGINQQPGSPFTIPLLTSPPTPPLVGTAPRLPGTYIGTQPPFNLPPPFNVGGGVTPSYPSFSFPTSSYPPPYNNIGGTLPMTWTNGGMPGSPSTSPGWITGVPTPPVAGSSPRTGNNYLPPAPTSTLPWGGCNNVTVMCPSGPITQPVTTTSGSGTWVNSNPSTISSGSGVGSYSSSSPGTLTYSPTQPSRNQAPRTNAHVTLAPPRPSW